MCSHEGHFDTKPGGKGKQTTRKSRQSIDVTQPSSSMEDETLLTPTSDFLSQTPIHGAQHIHNTQPPGIRAFYLICVTIALVITSTGVIFTINDLVRDTTYVTASLRRNGVREFPAVTICNLNPVLASKVQVTDLMYSELPTEEQQPTDHYPQAQKKRRRRDIHPGTSSYRTPGFRTDSTSYERSQYRDIWSLLYSVFLRFKYPVDTSWNTNLYRLRRQANIPSLTVRDDFYINNYTSRLSAEERMTFGHQLSKMLLACSYDGAECTSEHFLQFLDPIFGNCYTFKPERVEASRNHFPLYETGLDVELNIELPEYLPGVANAGGVQVYIGNPYRPAVPSTGQENGVTVSPGFKSRIDVSIEEHMNNKRLEGCVEVEPVASTVDRRVQLFRDVIPGIGYSRDSCVAACHQAEAIRQCSCCHYTLPCPGTARLCGARDLSCLRLITEGGGETDDCEENCQEECVLRKYVLTTHFSRWPLPRDEAEVRTRMNERYYPTSTMVPTTAGATPADYDEPDDITQPVTPSFEDSILEFLNRSRRDSGKSTADLTRNDGATYNKLSRSLSRLPGDKSQSRKRREIEDYPDGGYEGETPGYSDVQISAVKFQVQLSSPDLRVYETRTLVTWYRALAAIGGHMALWVGLSIMALIHACQVSSLWVWSWFKRGRNRENGLTRVLPVHES